MVFPPSSTMQARPQGGGFGVRFGVIPNRDFLSTSGEATKATAVAYVVLRISWHICMWAHMHTRTCTHTYYNFRKYKMTWFSMALWNTLSILSLSFSLYVLFPPPPPLKSSPIFQCAPPHHLCPAILRIWIYNPLASVSQVAEKTA